METLKEKAQQFIIKQYPDFDKSEFSFKEVVPLLADFAQSLVPSTQVVKEDKIRYSDKLYQAIKIDDLNEQAPLMQFVPVIDEDGEIFMFRRTQYGWNMRDSEATNTPNTNKVLKYWLKETSLITLHLTWMDELQQKEQEYENKTSTTLKLSDFSIDREVPTQKVGVEEEKWISKSEYPTNEEYVILSAKEGYPFIGYYDLDDKKYYNVHDDLVDDIVTRWMPLPTPPNQ